MFNQKDVAEPDSQIDELSESVDSSPAVNPRLYIFASFGIAIILILLFIGNVMTYINASNPVKIDNTTTQGLLTNNEISYLENTAKIVFRDYLTIALTGNDTDFSAAKKNLLALSEEKSPYYNYLLTAPQKDNATTYNFTMKNAMIINLQETLKNNMVFVRVTSDSEDPIYRSVLVKFHRVSTGKFLLYDIVSE